MRLTILLLGVKTRDFPVNLIARLYIDPMSVVLESIPVIIERQKN